MLPRGSEFSRGRWLPALSSLVRLRRSRRARTRVRRGAGGSWWDSGGGGRGHSVRRSPPSPFCARNLALSRSSSKSSSFASPGVKTLPASNSSFFSCFFRFLGRSSACIDIGCLQLRGVGIEELDATPCAVVHDHDGPIDHLDIERVANLPTKLRPGE